MKVLPFTIPKPKRDALIVQEDLQAVFYGVLHRHEEFQLSYVMQGEGSLIVADTVGFYKPGDVIILGSNLPHVFKSDPRASDTSHMLSVFFTKASFGTHFFEMEELKSLQSFFRKAENGFRLTHASEKWAALFQRIQKASKLDRFILFFQLLKQLNAARYEGLSTFNSEKKYSDTEGQRMGAVFQYTMNHFREKITLEEIAKTAAMTPNAFCNYFKKRTRKTYITFLNEIRIEEACRLLRAHPERSMAVIAEQSGFQNISNFNRKFRQIKQCQPRKYRIKRN
jgi:AraC-like DNA-binding protein/quercetin dioxygenase-like cupin family protein